MAGALIAAGVCFCCATAHAGPDRLRQSGGSSAEEEAREQVRGLIHNWVLDSVEEKARRELT